jgi:TolB-like protein/DNA-binding winged helix-turn-helix (wHTH) protein/Flp pilus assembly protein TadD
VQEERPQSRIIKFGVFEVDLEAGELRKSGMRQKLAAQPFQVLQLLLEHPQQVVSREQLKHYLWPDNTVVDFDLALKKVVNRVREVLGDSADNPRFIETIPRRGYRFIASVNCHGDVRAHPGLPTDAPAKPRWSGRNLPIGIALGVGAMVLLVAILALVDSRSWRHPSGEVAAPQIRSLAVLPLQNLSADPEQEYFSDGITDALITDLAQIGTLKVISRTSSMQYKQTKKSLPEIARELNVEGIIEGAVQRSGDRVRITAQLVHGPSDMHLWAAGYERDVRDIFALEREVTEDIALQVKGRLTSPERNRPGQPRPVDPKVLEAYLQGNYHLGRNGEGFGTGELEKAAEYFRKAIDADPNFAPAYNGLAWAYENRLSGSSEDVAIARRAAEKAVELDPNYSDALATLGFIKWQPYLDWQGAEANFRRAIALNPNNADAHVQFGTFLVAMGRVDEGVRECHIAQQLNPNQATSSACLYFAHDYDGSIAILRMMLWKNPNDRSSHAYLSANYIMKGMHKESMQEFAECYSLIGFPKEATNIRHALAVSGAEAALRQIAKETEHLQEEKKLYMPGLLAAVYANLGDKDRAFYWLEQAYEHRDMTNMDEGVFYLGSEPLYDSLRSDPRYKDLLRRVGLPE